MHYISSARIPPLQGNRGSGGINRKAWENLSHHMTMALSVRTGKSWCKISLLWIYVKVIGCHRGCSNVCWEADRLLLSMKPSMGQVGLYTCCIFEEDGFALELLRFSLVLVDMTILLLLLLLLLLLSKCCLVSVLFKGLDDSLVSIQSKACSWYGFISTPEIMDGWRATEPPALLKYFWEINYYNYHYHYYYYYYYLSVLTLEFVLSAW